MCLVGQESDNNFVNSLREYHKVAKIKLGSYKTKAVIEMKTMPGCGGTCL